MAKVLDVFGQPGPPSEPADTIRRQAAVIVTEALTVMDPAMPVRVTFAAVQTPAQPPSGTTPRTTSLTLTIEPLAGFLE